MVLLTARNYVYDTRTFLFICTVLIPLQWHATEVENTAFRGVWFLGHGGNTFFPCSYPHLDQGQEQDSPQANEASLKPRHDTKKCWENLQSEASRTRP